MGTRGYFAYRYKNRYYRTYMNFDSYPEGRGRDLVANIPEDPLRREAWVAHVIKGLEKEMEFRRSEGIADHDEDSGGWFEDITDDRNWLLPEVWIEWTYVFDFDNRAFTVNGTVHFNLDKMPPRDPGIEVYFYQDICVPNTYLTRVNHWSAITFDVGTVHKKYEALQPVTLSLEEWGAPNWNQLTVSQHLSVKLVTTIIDDHRFMLSAAGIPLLRSRVSVVCWQIACAAAPSHLLCPLESDSSSDITYASMPDSLYDDGMRTLSHRLGGMIGNPVSDCCYWFRGCLVAFCDRLDEERCAEREVVRITAKLRRRGGGCTGALGIMMSSYQVVAVAVDGLEIRRSQVLDIYDSNNHAKEGLLLLMHMLGPALTENKTPWRTSSSTLSYNVSKSLPEEVIRFILYFADDETYNITLPRVSRYVRAFCLQYPRVAGCTLIGIDQDTTYKILRPAGASLIEMRASLLRTTVDPASTEHLRVFQHHQVGIAGTRPSRGPPSSRKADNVTLIDMLAGRCSLPVRIQSIHGVWDMSALEV